MQYVRDTTISFKNKGPQRIPAKIAKQIGTSHKQKWLAFHGQRLKLGRERPVAMTVAWINPELTDAVGKIDITGATLFGQIEEHADVSVTRITQDIQAIPASKKFARDLGLEEGDPVLRILRCYFDQNDRLIEISANYHPGERFAYSMHIAVE